MNEFILSIDIGTTNCKAFIFNKKGELVFGSRVGTKKITNRLGPGWVEIDAHEQKVAVFNAIKNCVVKGLNRSDEIVGVGITAMRQSIVPVDGNGNALRHIIPWEVKATYPQARIIREHVGIENFYNITGLTISPLWGLPSILYIKEVEPKIFDKTCKILEVQDYIHHKLTHDEFVTDYSQASCISLLDIESLEWSTEICNTLHIPREKLPTLRAPGDIAGKISKQAAHETGLRENTPVILGGGDTQASALGCGVIHSGIANTIIGTSAVANLHLENPFFDPQQVLVCHPHTYKGKYILDHNTLTGGNAYSWYLHQFFPNTSQKQPKEDITPYELINKSILEGPVGSNGLLFLPHFVGAASPYWNDLAKGVFLGIDLLTDKINFGRAIIEGVSLELRKGLELMEKYGFKIDQVRTCGGTSQSDSPWCQIQADVYGKPVCCMESTETTALGSVILSSVALGFYPDVETAVRKMVRCCGEYTPDMRAHEKYTSLLEIHNKIYEAMDKASIYQDLANFIITYR